MGAPTQEEVYNWSSKIINKYYGDDEEESAAGFAPQVSDKNQYVFGHSHPGQGNFHF
jgi:hypothetical protein